MADDDLITVKLSQTDRLYASFHILLFDYADSSSKIKASGLFLAYSVVCIIVLQVIAIPSADKADLVPVVHAQDRRRFLLFGAPDYLHSLINSRDLSCGLRNAVVLPVPLYVPAIAPFQDA